MRNVKTRRVLFVGITFVFVSLLAFVMTRPAQLRSQNPTKAPAATYTSLGSLPYERNSDVLAQDDPSETEGPKSAPPIGSHTKPEQDLLERKTWEASAKEVYKQAFTIRKKYQALEEINGKVIVKSPEGKKIRVVVYDADGNQAASLAYYSWSDGLNEIVEYNGEKQHGWSVYYRADGSPEYFYPWYDHNLHGTFYAFDENGELNMVRQFERNHFLGAVVEWDENGKPMKGSKVYTQPYAFHPRPPTEHQSDTQ